MKKQNFYEVQSYGVTLDIDKDFRKVESAFNQAANGGYGQVKMYSLDPATSKKTLIRKK